MWHRDRVFRGLKLTVHDRSFFPDGTAERLGEGSDIVQQQAEVGPARLSPYIVYCGVVAWSHVSPSIRFSSARARCR